MPRTLGGASKNAVKIAPSQSFSIGGLGLDSSNASCSFTRVIVPDDKAENHASQLETSIPSMTRKPTDVSDDNTPDRSAGGEYAR